MCSLAVALTAVNISEYKENLFENIWSKAQRENYVLHMNIFITTEMPGQGVHL